ncbi:hypothetical protein EST38_g2130 [Candolleomyces aberdarensis]|uniref:7alpha-cephem-methoxylase P8 chain n=1 Tax=Candolleomyces aberdarensis TaxID=2316362 RepID=A0A4Q2DWB4_9AGAR|nr:hypothetical protein EST38_g2130 [Candolleomyces aberdarensis]
MSTGDFSTTLNYCVPFPTYDPKDPLVKYVFDPPPGIPKQNFELQPFPATIHDLRNANGVSDIEQLVSLDVHGFQFVNNESKEKDFDDEEGFKDGYYKEVEQLVLDKVPGAKKVVIFDHTLRRLAKEPTARQATSNDRGPILRVHIDQTLNAVYNRVRRHLPSEDAERLLSSKTRVRLINVWRPIQNTVAHNPLALADWRSVDGNHDLLDTRRVLEGAVVPEPNGGLYNVRHNEKHQWYYLSNQTPEEVTFIQCCDSKVVEEGAAGAVGAPHTSFNDTRSPPEAPRRQSIEVRCLVFDAE